MPEWTVPGERGGPALGRVGQGALLALGLVACAPSTDATGPGGLRRPELGPADDAREPARGDLVRRLEPPAGLAPWRVVCEDFEVLGETDGSTTLELRAGGQVGVPGPFEPGAFSQLAVVGRFSAPHDLHLGLHFEAGEPLVLLRSVLGDPEREQTIVFDLLELRRSERTLAEIRLGARGEGFDLRAFELRDMTLARALPGPDEPGLIEIGQDARHGVGVAGGAPLVTSLAARAGDVLEFSYGQPESVRSPGPAPRLVVTLSAEERVRARRIPLESDLATPSAWREERIELDEFAGLEVSARFELATAEGVDAVCGLANLAVVRKSRDERTIVLITSDTHRGDHLGASRSTVEIATPNLDALAARGVLFEDCFSTTNITSPSHLAMLAGLSPRDTGLVNNEDRISSAVYTLAEAFREQGFETYAVVSVSHLGPHGSGLGEGFERMAGPSSGTWRAGESVSRLLEWLPAAEGRPLFVWLHLFDAHHPYDPPPPFDGQYYPDDRDPFDPALGPALEAGHAPDDLVGVRDLEYPKALYRGEVSYLDRELGRFLETPRVRDGVICFTADHGEVLAKKGVHFAHSGLYPDTLHVPLILSWPDGPRGERVSRPVQHLDLGRTLLDLAGLQAAEFPGDNLLRAELEAGAADAPRFALQSAGDSATIAYRNWFLTLHLRSHRSPNSEPHEEHEVELFDRSVDPECLVNVADTDPERTRRLRALVVEWLVAASPTSLAEEANLSAEALAELAALGYTTGVRRVEGNAWIDPDCACERCEPYR